MNENEISNRIIGLGIDIHQSLGPGLVLIKNAYTTDFKGKVFLLRKKSQCH